MVRRNVGPRNYRFKAVFTPAGSYSGIGVGVTSFGTATIQWGADFPTQGVKATYGVADSPAASGGSLVIESPYFTTISTGILSYIGADVEIEIDGLSLSVPPPCTGSTWSFTEMRIFVDGALLLTLGPTGGTDTYSHRKNWMGMEAEDSPASLRPCGPGCPGPGVVSTLGQTTQVSGGYQIDDGSGYASETVAMLAAGVLAPGAVACRDDGCDCTEDLPAVTGTDSYAVLVSAGSYFFASDTVSTEDCYCPTDPPTFAGTIHLHDSFARRWRQYAYVHIVSTAHGIPYTGVRKDTCCGCACIVVPDDCDFDDDADTEAITYCETYRYVESWAGHDYCAFDWIPCPYPPGGNCGSLFENDLCFYRASVHVYWPTEPSCGGESASGPHNSRDFLGRYTRVSAKDGQLWLLRADAGSPRGGWHHELLWGSNVSTPRGLWNREFAFELVYRNTSDGHVYWTRSTDDCNTFETPELLFMASKYPDAFHDSRWTGFSVFKHDSGSSGVGKIYLRLRGPDDNAPGAEFTVKDAAGVAISFEDDSCGITVPEIGPNAWVLTAKKAGDTEPSEWESTDNGASWEQV